MQIKIAKSTRYVVIVSLFVIVIAELVQLNLGETVAIYWHLGHGFSERCCGVDITVPLMYFGGKEDNESLSLITTPGYLRSLVLHSPHAMIRIAKNSTDLDEEHIRLSTDRVIRMWGHSGYRLRGTRTIQVAGSPLTCSELYLERLGAVGPGDQVLCIGRGRYAYFSGSPGLRDEFYSIVRTAKVTPQ